MTDELFCERAKELVYQAVQATGGLGCMFVFVVWFGFLFYDLLKMYKPYPAHRLQTPGLDSGLGV